ncbi:pectate lyase-domain-containing protein [Dactylonectria macrodidyma]|uniref:Pectate lyase n=1 Tax=Dactylonectria macrodidyma TaxID=307937 RepID=A0A9P9DVL8_9HYPO|nr:pectate lyase-domain-containing protein [Dactylonectria macrodidyma]
MRSLFTVLALLPAAFGCLDPDSNSCASFIKSQSATASAFCSTFTKSVVTATSALPSWATNCSQKPSLISKECSCYYTGTAATQTSAGSGGTAPTGVTTTLPASSGVVTSAAPITVTSSFDGGMKRYDRSTKVCDEQTETGEDDTIFILEDGATLSNVIIGPNQAEGVHCRGTCTLNNVWWSDVCEDALTLKQSSGTSYINGGGAFHAEDKIIQFNGRGTVQITNFYANDYGKVVRSCGNCSGNGGPRNIIMTNVIAVDGGVLCGINTNYGDTCIMTNCCQDDGKTCDRYTGNSSGSEPTKIGSGPDGTYCIASGASTNC